MARRRIRTRWKAAAIQMTSTADVERNVARAERLVRRAAAAGAALAALPENFAYLRTEGSPADLFQTRPRRRSDRPDACALWHAGPSPALAAGLGARSRCRAADGSTTASVLARDLAAIWSWPLPQAAPVRHRGYRGGVELRRIEDGQAPGRERLVVAETRTGFGWGLSICYDLRFPELYRQLAHSAGAQCTASFQRLSQPIPGPTTGLRCCWAPGRSRTSAGSSRRHRSAVTRPTGSPTARR